MQAALFFAPSLPPQTPIRMPAKLSRSLPKLHNAIPSRSPVIKAMAAASDTSSTVDYNSASSVFPAEACETLGGDACNPEIYPEVKLKPEARSTDGTSASEQVDREYFEYNDPKTVFPGEACDDLGGEFCEPDYQKGVY